MVLECNRRALPQPTGNHGNILPQYMYNKVLASVSAPPGSSKVDAAETAIRYRLYECAVRRKALHVAKRVVC